MNDLSVLFYREEEVRRWKAESENANARLEIAHMRERMAMLLSQHEPVNSLNIDREALRKIFGFVEFNRSIKEELEE